MTIHGFPEVFPRIETGRLLLREITQDDAMGIFKNFSDPEVAKWFFEQPFTEMKQATQIIAEFKRDFTGGKGLTWAIILKENEACIGTCGYGDLAFGERGEIVESRGTFLFQQHACHPSSGKAGLSIG
jgi:ribosomal-protein-alanine N-acetyltransferase